MLGAILLILLADITHIEDLMEQVEWTTLVFFSALFILMQVGWNNSIFIILLNKSVSTPRWGSFKTHFNIWIFVFMLTKKIFKTELR